MPWSASLQVVREDDAAAVWTAPGYQSQKDGPSDVAYLISKIPAGTNGGTVI